MKFFTRVKLAVVLSALMVMLASSAWAATYTIGADVRLNNTGARMELKLTYLKDGHPDPIWNILTAEQREVMGSVFAMELYLNNDNLPGGGSRYESESPIVINEDSLEVVFLFTSALEEGYYIFQQFCFVGNDETKNWSQDDWDAFQREHGIDFEIDIDRPYKGDDDHLNKVNGGNPVLIQRESVSKVPGAPTDVTATAGDRRATVSFKAPTDDGGSAITSYIVTSNPGSVTATGTTTTITVTGLTNGTAYTFAVKAVNSVGNGPSSAASNSVTPTPGSSGGGGCNAGYGIIGLLLAGLVTRKYRKA